MFNYLLVKYIQLASFSLTTAVMRKCVGFSEVSTDTDPEFCHIKYISQVKPIIPQYKTKDTRQPAWIGFAEDITTKGI